MSKNKKSTKKEEVDKDAIIAEGLEKAVKKTKKSGDGTPHTTIDSVTMELLKTPGGMTLSEIHQAIMKKFPGHDSDVLKNTTKRRLNGYLANKFGVTIKKNNDGKYSIASKKVA